MTSSSPIKTKWDGMLERIGIDDSGDESESSVEEYEECDCVDLERVKADKIPYVSVYEDCDDKDPTYFVPAEPVTAKIVAADVEPQMSHHILNPLLYTIELKHGPYTWVVTKRHSDFSDLNHGLQRFRIKEKMKQPYRKVKKLRQSRRGSTDTGPNEGGIELQEPRNGHGGHSHQEPLQVPDQPLHRQDITDSKPLSPDPKVDAVTKAADAAIRAQERDDRLKAFGCKSKNHNKKNHICKLPHFPITPERMFLSSNEALDERQQELEDYLNIVLHIAAYRNHQDTAKFLEVSRLSFVHNIGAKSKEGFIKKCPGGRRTYQGCKKWCISHCAPWGERWLLVKDSFVAYLDDNEQIRAVMLYDADFGVQLAKEDEDVVGGKHGLVITNLARHLQLRTDSKKHAHGWRESIMHMAKTRGKVWLDPHRYGSYSPVREHVYAQWFCDARTQFEHAANMIQLAKEDIFITDWWLSPEIYLKRPRTEGERWRLDVLLKRKAEEGVRVFVLLYKEVEVALGIASSYSKLVLQNQHENIKVIRHPDHTLDGVFLWAHHEKLIIIDQNIAFVGGIDLCFGRWDDYQHRLTDLGSVRMDPTPAIPQIQGAEQISSGARMMSEMMPTVPLATPENTPNSRTTPLHSTSACPTIPESSEGNEDKKFLNLADLAKIVTDHDTKGSPASEAGLNTPSSNLEANNYGTIGEGGGKSGDVQEPPTTPRLMKVMSDVALSLFSVLAHLN